MISSSISFSLKSERERFHRQPKAVTLSALRKGNESLAGTKKKEKMNA